MTLNSSSSEGDTKEAMETSGGDVTLLVGEKRKVESINSEDSGESEEGSQSEEGSESDEEIEDRFKWGYDSFEGLEYHSSEQDEYSDKEYEREWRYFNRQLIETEGFFESSDKFPCRFGGIGAIPDLEASGGRFGTARELCTKLASACIKKYTKENKKNIKVEEILRANFNPSSMSKFYITFLAKEFDEFSNDAHTHLVEYQAKAVWSCADRIYPLLCRPSPRKNAV